MDLILKAAQFAAKAHAGQTRKYEKTPYVHHPARVAGRVAVRPDATEVMVAAAFLHDVLEDAQQWGKELGAQFGDAVLSLVQEMTNPSMESTAPRAERKRMDREHLAKASREAKVIKMLDRIDNLTDAAVVSNFAPMADWVKMYARESLLLVEVIGQADPELEKELRDLANQLIP